MSRTGDVTGTDDDVSGTEGLDGAGDGSGTGDVTGTGGAGGDGPTGEPAEDRVPRSARLLVAVLLLALVVPGVIGAELWPLTGWKLFSLSREDTANRWVLEGVQADGTSRLVSLEELPLGFRHAEWPLRSVPNLSPGEQEDMCQALAGAVVEADPTIVELRIARDAQELVEADDGSWEVRHELDVRYACVPGEEG